MVDREKTFSLLQIETLLLEVDRGENPLDLRVGGGYFNRFFVARRDGNVLVVNTCRGFDGWWVDIDFVRNVNGCSAGDVVLFGSSVEPSSIITP